MCVTASDNQKGIETSEKLALKNEVFRTLPTEQRVNHFGLSSHQGLNNHFFVKVQFETKRVLTGYLLFRTPKMRRFKVH